MVVTLSENKHAKFIEIRPGVFRTFRLYDDFGTRSHKTFSEAMDRVQENKGKWVEGIRGDYQYQVRMVEETILIFDDNLINNPPIT